MSEKPSPIEIFDASLIRERLRRSEKRGLENFLIPSCIDELIDRLAGIKRRFTRIVDIGTPSELLSWRLTDVFHEARILRLGPIRENELEHGDVSEDLRLEPESRDLAVSVLALQAANDLPGIFAQVRRSLRPDGLFLGCLLGGQSLKELRLSFAAAESELNDGASPRVAPFVDVRDLGGLLQRAGFALPVADIDSITVRYAHPLNLMRDLRAMGATNAMKSRDRRPLKRQILMRACEFYVDNFADPDGRIRATFDIVWLSGWAPDASQQKPARPGSAQMRLADVLPTKYDDDGKR